MLFWICTAGAADLLDGAAGLLDGAAGLDFRAGVHLTVALFLAVITYLFDI
jgi:hypothetical protein